MAYIPVTRTQSVKLIFFTLYNDQIIIDKRWPNKKKDLKYVQSIWRFVLDEMALMTKCQKKSSKVFVKFVILLLRKEFFALSLCKIFVLQKEFAILINLTLYLPTLLMNTTMVNLIKKLI